MNYLITLHYRDGEGPVEGTPEFDAEMKVWHALTQELKDAGCYVAASGLQPESATTVRADAITDGPFAETKEVLFSFYILNLENLDEATKWAQRMPAVQYGSVTIHATVNLEFA
jgi:hypothetical protein